MKRVFIFIIFLLSRSLLAGEELHFTASGDEGGRYLLVIDSRCEFYEVGFGDVITRSDGTVSISGDTWSFAMNNHGNQYNYIGRERYIEKTVEGATYLVPISQLDNFIIASNETDSFTRWMMMKWYLKKVPCAPAFINELPETSKDEK